jgi:alpha-tubulin suppressor-like RCC1 family protein
VSSVVPRRGDDDEALFAVCSWLPYASLVRKVGLLALLVSCGLDLTTPNVAIMSSEAGSDVAIPAYDAEADVPVVNDGGDAGPAEEYQRLAVGGAHSCAIVNGTVKCWGLNNLGQLGTEGAYSLAPVLVPGLASERIVSVGAGATFTCALTATGGVACWGGNFYGELGNGTFSSPTTRGPAFVSGLERGVRSLGVGPYHSCAILLGGEVKCWGFNTYNAVGDSTALNRSAPTRVVGLGLDVAQVSAGLYHTCARTISGAAKCWGANNNGQAGDGTYTPIVGVVQVGDLTKDVRSIGAGYAHACVLQIDRVLCWGYNSKGQLGTGSSETWLPTPTPLATLTGTVTRVVPGPGEHTCAVVDETVKCWGELLPWLPRSRTPVDIADVTGASEVGAGNVHFCALTKTNQVYCWGDNTYGQLGDGTQISRAKPMPVVGL